MLKVELLIDDDKENEEMVSREVLRILMENGIQISKCNIEHAKRIYKKPELVEVQIPEFLKKCT